MEAAIESLRERGLLEIQLADFCHNSKLKDVPPLTLESLAKYGEAYKKERFSKHKAYMPKFVFKQPTELCCDMYFANVDSDSVRFF